MCRMIMALGNFSVKKLVDAAVAMSLGETAKHDGPTKYHPNGWGMIWYNKSCPNKLSIYHDDQPISKGVRQISIENINTNFLAIHIRHATILSNIGINYSHPINIKDYKTPWYMMHNGFLPTVYEKLGQDCSIFDSEEYYKYIVPKNDINLNVKEVINKLNKLKPDGTSANAIVVNSNKIYVIHWTMPNIKYKNYFTMYGTYDENAFYIASEIQPTIMDASEWQSLKSSMIYEYEMPHDVINNNLLKQYHRGLYD